jgi:hypothetical protein
MTGGEGARAVRLVRPAVLFSWAVAAVLAGSVVWWAVAAIGSEQGGATVFTQAQVEVLSSQSVRAGATSTPSSTPTETANLVPSATPTATPTTAPTQDPSPSAAPTASGTSSPRPVHPTATPTSSPVSTPTTAPTASGEVARTWNVSGGQVGVVCRGAQISLLYATPDDGWSVEVNHGGPDQVDVKFSQSETETRVRAICTGGVPERVAEAEHD